MDNEGNDITHYFVKEYEFCCGELLIQDTPSYLCYEALEDCTLLCISKNDLQSLIETSEPCKNIYIKLLELSLRYKIKREYGFLVKNATERYIEFKEREPELEDRIQQTNLASYLGITPVSLSRIRKALKEE